MKAQTFGRLTAMALLCLAAACGGDDENGNENNGNDNNGNGGGSADTFDSVSCADFTGNCTQFITAEVNDLLTAVNSLSDDSTLVLSSGTFEVSVEIVIPEASNITLIGQGMDATTVDFSGNSTQGDGIRASNQTDFRIEGMTLVDSPDDALRVEASTGVTIRAVRTTWTGGKNTSNGAYGLYPVNCTDVLMEDCEASFASDAGIYVGQSQNVIVRNNLAEDNVAGIEIENTQFADVYGNTASNNTGGLVIFDLPGNPIVGRDVRIHDNTIEDNNGENFATVGSVVSQIPPGTGTFLLASRRVELFNNTWTNNDTVAVAILSGLAVEDDTNEWAIPKDQVVGDISGLALVDTGTAWLNFGTNEVLIRNNTFSNNGTAPQGNQSTQPLGALIVITYLTDPPVDAIIYDTIGESSFDTTTPGSNSNDNVICVDSNSGASFGSLDLPTIGAIAEGGGFPTTDDIFQPESPFAPFDCDALTGGPVVEVTLP